VFLHSFWESSFHSRTLLQATLALSYSRICVEIDMLWLFHIFCSDASIACRLFNLVRNSVVHSPSSVIRDPWYGNVFTCCSSSFIYCIEGQCSRIPILHFLGLKNVTFWRPFEMTCQKVVSKSSVLNLSKWVHILRSVITVAIQFSYVFVSLVYLRTYRHLSHTHILSCVVSCECEHYVRISEQRYFMLATYRYWLSVIVY